MYFHWPVGVSSAHTWVALMSAKIYILVGTHRVASVGKPTVELADAGPDHPQSSIS